MAGATTDMTKLLKTCVGGLQQSFGVVFERLNQNVAQTSQMMEMMNSMMEEMIVRNLKLEIHLSNSILTLFVKNQTSIPLKSLKCSVQMDSEDAQVSVQGSACGAFDLDKDETIEFNFPIESFSAESMMMQCKNTTTGGIVRIEFPSPGTSNTLVSLKKFQLLRLHHLSFSLTSSSCPMEEQSKCVTVSALVIRKLLQVSDYSPLVLHDAGHYIGAYGDAEWIRVALEKHPTDPSQVIVSCGPDEEGWLNEIRQYV